MKLYDTIAAIATPQGAGGVAIVRISGFDAETIADKIIKTKNGRSLTELDTHHMVLSKVHRKESELRRIDEALVVVMRAPNSYTGETVVEIQCHGGFFAARTILDELLLSGARLAEAGEFTRRAFLNGRIDLTGTEATMDIIEAHSEAGLETAATVQSGKLKEKIDELREDVLTITTHISATVDYPDEVDAPENQEVTDNIDNILSKVDTLLNSFKTGRILREGISTAIVGCPNVGKSSILNAMAGTERAIVTDIPGTTRDVVEEYINIEGVALRLLDTAGIRKGADTVEEIGIERAMENMRTSDLCLFVIDSEAGITDTDREIAKELIGKTVLVILNKTDKTVLDKEVVANELGFSTDNIIATATPKDKEPQGMEELRQAILDRFLSGGIIPGAVYLFSERQKDSLLKAKDSLCRARELIAADLPFDLLHVDLEDALSAFGEITGTTVRDEVIDNVFSRFCVGK